MEKDFILGGKTLRPVLVAKVMEKTSVLLNGSGIKDIWESSARTLKQIGIANRSKKTSFFTIKSNLSHILLIHHIDNQSAPKISAH